MLPDVFRRGENSFISNYRQKDLHSFSKILTLRPINSTQGGRRGSKFIKNLQKSQDIHPPECANSFSTGLRGEYRRFSAIRGDLRLSKLVCELRELLAALLEVCEHIVTGTGGTEQHDIAVLGQPICAIDRLGH